ncbi:MAG: response regulator [Deltaproteobacteria bacterium]|nr:response regulator [Deltaproteobacteria bacterium]
MTDEATRRLRHDLRTPIHQILGYSELLAEEAEENGREDMLPDLRRIAAAARELLPRIDALLEGDSIPPSLGAISAADRTSSSSPAAPEVQVGGGVADGRSLLVVDDDERNRDVLSRRLVRSGFSVLTARDGREALAMIAEQRFDLVLLDVNMPDLSGMEVLERVRRVHPASDLPIIMATARGDAEDVVEALRRGANDYVTKPLDYQVVLARIGTQLALKQANERVRTLAAELAARNRLVRAAFGRYVSDEVAQTLLASPEGLSLGGETRRVTILMSDLRGFTSLVESLPAQSVVLLLNAYLGTMADVILAHGGTIDEFIGDGILAVFGAPVSRDDHALRAVACAIAMQNAMGELESTRVEVGAPPLRMGVAVNTGDVVVGNIGSLKRTKYGVVGAAVNLASRIESLSIGGQVLASRATLDAAGPHVRVGPGRFVRVKGVADLLEVVEVHGVEAPVRLELARTTVIERALSAALPVRFVRVEGKLLEEAVHLGMLVRVSDDGGTIDSDVEIDVLANVRLEIGDARAEAYAKVLDASPGSFRVHFTSLAPTADALLRAALVKS